MKHGWRIGLIVLLLTAHAQAQSPDKIDSRLPVEITADSLEVLEKENKAIFSGNVLAKQGQVTIKADKMVVHRSADAASAAVNKISSIAVLGNVFLATPGETAKSQQGLYDVLKKKIILQGDVVLTREKNVLKGEHLEYNLASGRSVLSSGSAAEGGTGKGRVKGLFVPQEEKPKQ